MVRRAVLTTASFLAWSLAAIAQRGVQVIVTDTQGKTIPLYRAVHALVVGVGKYQQLPQLPGVYNEVEEAGSLFKELGYEVTVLHDPTSANLKKALNRLTYDVSDPNDAVVIFFAGHGYTEKLVDGSQLGYILPVDCPLYDKDPGKFVDLAVSMSNIREYALRTKAKHMLCIFDSCFSGTIFYASRSIPERVSYDTAQPVRQFITAGTEKEEVPDVSIFFKTLKRGLAGEADVNRDGYVTASELGMYLQDNVEKYSANAEHPQYGKLLSPDLDKGDFVFVMKATRAAPSEGLSGGRGIAPTIHVWSVGSPHTGGKPESTVPLDIKLQAGRLGYQIEMETFEAKGFAEKFFDAVAQKTEPDILTIDNYGIIEGITTKLGSFTGLASSKSVQRSLINVSESLKDFEGKQGGWEFLVSTSQNNKIARAFAMRKPECDPAYVGRSSVAAAELDTVKQMAVSASYAYLTCNSVDMRKISDNGRLGRGCLTDPPAKVASSSVCGVLGNQNLVFVPTIDAFEVEGKVAGRPEAGGQLGHKTLLAVLRKDGDRMKLLTITDDPISIEQLATSPHSRGYLRPYASFETTGISRLSGLLRSGGGADSQSVVPAALVTPDGTYPAPEQGKRFGDFIWRPSSSSSVVCEVAEFEYGRSTRLFFFFTDRDWTGRVSAGELYGGSYHWRIWSVADSGRLVLSESRSFKY